VPSIERPIDYMDINVTGHCARARMRAGRERPELVYAASSSCYGLAATPTGEGSSDRASIPICSVEIRGRASGVSLGRGLSPAGKSICIFNAYGPRVRTTGAYGAVFGVLFRQKLAGKPFTVVGDGSQRRDFIYVTDVANAFLARPKPMASENASM